MVITDINAQRRKGRYNIYVDGEFYSGLDMETIVKASLKVGSIVDEKKLKELVFESEKRSAFSKASDLLSRQMYSEKDLISKLIKKGYSKEVAKAAASQLSEYKYISDEEYAKLYVESKPLKSKREIKNKLMQKGVSREDIEQATSAISQEDEEKRAFSLAKKYVGNKEIDENALRKLYAFLYRKGFTQESIQKVIRAFKIDIDLGEDDGWD